MLIELQIGERKSKSAKTLTSVLIETSTLKHIKYNYIEIFVMSRMIQVLIYFLVLY